MINRREFLQKSLIGAAALSIPSHLIAGSASKTLTILHTNDLHSRIDPFDEGRNKGKGGMARRATLIEKLRKENKNLLLLDAGDIWQGTPYFNFFNGELEYKLMSQMGYDAATLGNHDFDGGMENILKQLPLANFPFLIANYDFSSTILKNAFQPYKIFNKNGLKIGVFGLGIELKGLVPDKLYKETIYLDPVEKAKEMTQELHNKKCDLVICLSHLGYKYDSENKISDLTLAAKIPGIDIIIGGHTHTFLEKPNMIINPEGKEVLVNQAGWGGILLGKIDVTFNQGKKTMSGTSMIIDESIEFAG